MKQGILNKIINDNIEVELNDILTEIQEAADNIILKHKGVEEPPQLKKIGNFSFSEYALNCEEVYEEQSKGEDLGRIDEVSEDNSNLIRLPAFQDDAGNISSIASDL